MSVTIFYLEGGSDEKSLELEDDGTLIYSLCPNYWAYRKGARGEVARLTVAEAKNRWPLYASDIDRALREMKQPPQTRTIPSPGHSRTQ